MGLKHWLPTVEARSRHESAARRLWQVASRSAPIRPADPSAESRKQANLTPIQMWYIPAPDSSDSRRAMSAIVVSRKVVRRASTPSSQMPPASLPS